MNIVAQLKLVPTPAQAERLIATMRAFNAAANYAVGVAFDLGLVRSFDLHKHVYRSIREKFGIPADMAVRVVAQAVEALSRDRSIRPEFRGLAAIPYTPRHQYGFKGADGVSLQVAPSGREVMPFVCGEYQRRQLGGRRGQADLLFRDGEFYLSVSVTVPTQATAEVPDFIGVDLGIVEIATTDDGESFSGKPVEASRKRNARARQTYQRRNTRSARRRLRKMAKGQSRYQRNENHRISKAIVAKAKALGFGIGLEDLSGIRGRLEATANGSFRHRLGNWSFHQLRTFVEYKARLAGVPVVPVDPAYTSQTCSACGHCERANRKSQSCFCCKKCAFTLNADVNGARNIRSKALGALVDRPDSAAAPA